MPHHQSREFHNSITMASDLEKRTKEAFIDDHFELAVDLYSQAIDFNPNNVELFADRAQANIKLSNFTDIYVFSLVLANDITTANELVINYTDGLALFAFLNSTKSPKASITQAITQLGTKPTLFMAAFSSKGPNAITPEILKPDVTAPGVSVIAAYTGAQGPTDQTFDKRRVQQLNSISGTSMSCPHVSGIGLLLLSSPLS